MAVAAGTLGVLLMAGTAWAHVTVSPESAPGGSDQVLRFTVPNEEDNAGTTQVQIFFPTDKPIATVAVEPVAGWTAKVNTVKVTKPIQTDSGPVTEAVSDITWTGGPIAPGDFQQFPVSVGLPDGTGPLEFKALQTYSDGNVVRWIESTPKGGQEPEHPAPTLTLTADSGGSTTAVVAAVPKNVATTSDVDSAKTVGIIGIVVGAIGVILGAVALFTRRRAA